MTKTSEDERLRFGRLAERTKRSIDALGEALYNTNERDPHLRYLNLKTFRVEIMRGFVLYMHLALEDFLRALLFDFLINQNKLLTNKQTKRTVDEMRSADLIHWCGRLKLIKPDQFRDLLELNRVRNACAHNWTIDVPKYRSVLKHPRKRVTVPVVSYKERNLLSGNTFEREFCLAYGRLYLRLYDKVWKLRRKNSSTIDRTDDSSDHNKQGGSKQSRTSGKILTFRT